MSAASSIEPLVLGRYELGRHLGAGASGSVFRAVDTRSGLPVVIKFFDGEEDGFPPWASEMRLVLRFQHANIVACLDTGFDESHRLWVLVFDLAAGGSLRRALVSGRAFTARQTALLLLDVGSALAYAHAQGVVHREVYKIDRDCLRYAPNSRQRRRQPHDYSQCRRKPHIPSPQGRQ